MNFFRNLKQALALDQDFTTFSPNFQPKIVSKLGYQHTCIAFDPVQGYFAIGQQNGNVVLVNTVEYELANPENQVPGSAIVSLLFHKDQLIGTNATGQLIIWNLSSKTSFCQSFADPILKVDSNPESTWLIISFQSGLTKLMDCISGRFSEYYIALGLCSSTLKDMSLNPNDLNQIVLGFESECMIWDFAQKRPIEKFILQDNLTSCAWKPEGSYLVTGYADGIIAFWTMKKGFFGKSKVKPVFVKKYDNPISKLDWAQIDGDNSFLYIGFSGGNSIICLEIHGEKFERANETVISMEFVYTSFVVVIANTTRMLIANNYELPDLFISTSQAKSPVEIPACLRNASLGPHSTSCISDDGFLFCSAIKNKKSKSTPIAFGGTALAKNSVRNYHVQAILRNGSIEFWQMSIPSPTFLSIAKLLPSTPNIVELFLDIKQNCLVLMAEKSLIICELIKQSLIENVDEMMDQLDDTILALNEDRKEIKKLHDVQAAASVTAESTTTNPVAAIPSKSKSMESVKSSVNSSNMIPKSKSKDSLSTEKNAAGSIFKSKAGNPVMNMVKAFRKRTKNSVEGPDRDAQEVANVEGTANAKNIDIDSGKIADVLELPDSSEKAKSSELGPHPHKEGFAGGQAAAEMNLVANSTNSIGGGKVQHASAKESFEPNPTMLEYPRTSSLQGITIIDSPPLYLADANWTVLFQIDLLDPIVSYFCCASQRMYAVCTDNFLAVIHQDHSILFETKLSESSYFKNYDHLAENLMITKVAIYRVFDNWCIIVATTQSIFLFEIEKRKISPFAAYHCNKEFGLVLELDRLGHDFSKNPEEDENYLVLCSTNSVIIFEIDQGEISQTAGRDLGFSVSKAAVTQIDDKSVVVLVTAEAIIVLDIPQLTIIFKYSLSKLPIAKSHLSETYISSHDGLVGLWLQQNRWALLSLSTTDKLPQYELKIFDSQKMKKHSDQVGRRAGKRSEAADSLFASKVNPEKDIGADSLALDFAKIGNALDERGEKLNELQEKTGQVADASRTFADRARELARMEKEKKWYQL